MLIPYSSQNGFIYLTCNLQSELPSPLRSSSRFWVYPPSDLHHEKKPELRNDFASVNRITSNATSEKWGEVDCHITPTHLSTRNPPPLRPPLFLSLSRALHPLQLQHPLCHRPITPPRTASRTSPGPTPPPPAMALLQTSALSVPAAFASSAEVTTAAATSTLSLRTAFLAGRGVGRLSLSRQLGVQNGSRVSAWFKFGANGADSKEAGIYGSQKRDDFDSDDVEQVGFLISVRNSVPYLRF
jgi:hypothetical protein